MKFKNILFSFVLLGISPVVSVDFAGGDALALRRSPTVADLAPLRQGALEELQQASARAQVAPSRTEKALHGVRCVGTGAAFGGCVGVLFALCRGLYDITDSFTGGLFLGAALGGWYVWKRPKQPKARVDVVVAEAANQLALARYNAAEATRLEQAAREAADIAAGREREANTRATTAEGNLSTAQTQIGEAQKANSGLRILLEGAQTQTTEAQRANEELREQIDTMTARLSESTERITQLTESLERAKIAADENFGRLREDMGVNSQQQLRAMLMLWLSQIETARAPFELQIAIAKVTQVGKDSIAAAEQSLVRLNNQALEVQRCLGTAQSFALEAGSGQTATADADDDEQWW